MDVIEKPMGDPQELHFSLEPSCVSGNDVLEVEHLSKAFGNHKLFQDISFEIKRGEHVAIIGDNGTGKTTLLKILNQVVAADSGSFKLGSKVQIGYYDQEHHVLHMEKNILMKSQMIIQVLTTHRFEIHSPHFYLRAMMSTN